jgi:tetratricopeptide (TPR) repeat protein
MIGQTISHYAILERIGAGGMGVVYRAHDEQLDRDVAIKVLPTGTLADETARKRFRKEALALAKLNHSNIATVHEFGSQNGTDFLVTEYIPGLTLDAKLSVGALPTKEVIEMGMQLAQGLSAAHEQGIVHRDLKPGNLRLTSDGRLKILDFGLAQLMPHASEQGLTATLTKSQEVTGTLPYMSPEQLRAGVADARSDIWAAGAVLYEMATGQRAFEETVASALIDDIIHKAPASPRSVKSDVSPKLEAVILKCLEKEPTKRYQSARELQNDLERLSTGASPLAARWRLWPRLTAAAVLLVLLAAGGALYLRRGPKLTVKDTLVLADFNNKTGDDVFDDTLKQALSVALGQSPFLNVLSDAKVGAALKLMTRPEDTALTPEIAREVCQRTGARAYVAGSIASLGSQYVLGVKAVECQSGDTLADMQSTAASKEEVLASLGKAISELRGSLGESPVSVEKFDTPLVQATTHSLEALRQFSAARRIDNLNGDAAAIPFYKRAIELDPDFAAAYNSLAISYSDLTEYALATESAKKAYELRGRASERERYSIEENYYFSVTGELDRTNQVLEQWIHDYPRDLQPLGALALNHNLVGQYDKAVAVIQAMLQLNPDSSAGYLNLEANYAALNRAEDAAAAYRQSLSRNLEHPILHVNRYGVAFLQQDTAEMQRQLDWIRGKRGVEDMLLSMHSDTEAYFGHLRQAREFSRKAADSAVLSGKKESAAEWLLNAALREAELGYPAQAREQVTAAFDLAASKDVQTLAALALARGGETARAASLADELANAFPVNTLLNGYWLPTIRAAVEVDRRQAHSAVDTLRAALPYELGEPNPQAQIGGSLYPIYLRGEALLKDGRGPEAVVEFQKLLDHRGVVQNFVLGALARLQLGRAYELSGDHLRARISYEDFLKLWKDADPDIPILKQAKAEYSKLHSN